MYEYCLIVVQSWFSRIAHFQTSEWNIYLSINLFINYMYISSLCYDSISSCFYNSLYLSIFIFIYDFIFILSVYRSIYLVYHSIHHQIKDYACIYTFKASNLGFISPLRPLRPERDMMAHDHIIDGL